MTDYTKLIAALREEAEAVRAIEWEIPICTGNHIREAADVIEWLQKERDAAVKDLHEADNCNYCKYRELSGMEEPCRWCDVDEGEDKWEWRGLQNDKL